MNNEHTIWRYSLNSILDKGKSKDILFAVVKEIKDDLGDPYKLICWELELKSHGLKHPFYGIISYNDIKLYDLYIKGKGTLFPKTFININDNNFEKLGEIEDLSKLLWKRENY